MSTFQAELAVLDTGRVRERAPDGALDWSNAVEEIWPARRSPAFTPFTASESGLAKLPKSEHDWTGFDYRP